MLYFGGQDWAYSQQVCKWYKTRRNGCCSKQWCWKSQGVEKFGQRGILSSSAKGSPRSCTGTSTDICLGLTSFAEKDTGVSLNKKLSTVSNVLMQQRKSAAPWAALGKFLPEDWSRLFATSAQHKRRIWSFMSSFRLLNRAEIWTCWRCSTSQDDQGMRTSDRQGEAARFRRREGSGGSYKYVQISDEWCKENRVRLLPVVLTDRTSGNRHKTQEI